MDKRARFEEIRNMDITEFPEPSEDAMKNAENVSLILSHFKIEHHIYPHFSGGILIEIDTANILCLNDMTIQTEIYEDLII